MLLTYHVYGDLSNFGAAMFLTELPDLFLFFGDLFLQNALEVGGLGTQTSQQNRCRWAYFLFGQKEDILK